MSAIEACDEVDRFQRAARFWKRVTFAVICICLIAVALAIVFTAQANRRAKEMRDHAKDLEEVMNHRNARLEATATEAIRLKEEVKALREELDQAKKELSKAKPTHPAAPDR
jgi:predicted negative regulator of RcsB-dependent stress response